MQILKTYARLLVADLDTALPFYESIVGAPADLRFGFEQAELAAVGDFLLIAGEPEQIDRYRSTVGPVVVDDLGQLISRVTARGAEVTGGPFTSETGQFVYLRHPDGTTVEYVEWSAEVRAQANNLDRVTRRELEAVLDGAREALVRAVQPLTDEQSRRRLVPSLTSPITLLKHCAAAERVWFHRTVGGLAEADCDGYARGDDGGWVVPEGQTLAEVIAEFEAACARSREIAKSAAMDDMFVHYRRGEATYAWICLHMIEELGRHAGHADILVEQILAADNEK